MRLYLKAGHQIGKPVPLFTKIDQQRLDELKKKYGGVQDDAKSAKSATFSTVAEAEHAIKTQGDKVRQLKTSKVDKATIQPEVDLLLAYKKQLTALQAGGAAPIDKKSTSNNLGQTDPNDAAIKAIEAKIAEQGEKVRQLKAAKADKNVWQPEVNALLALKNELVALGGALPAAPAGSKKKK